MNQTKPNKGNILIIDDKPANLQILTLMLTQQGYQVRPAIDGRVALTAVRETPPDLILLDIMMPEMDGYEVCQRLKTDEQTRDIPIIFISARGQMEDKVKAFAVGGVDYITRPFQIEEVLARVKAHLALRDMQKRLQAQKVQLEQEIAERKRAEEALQQLAHDLGERVKELNCLYGISNLVETPDISLEEILRGTVDLIPPAWQYPEITCARIILEGQEFSTKNFQESPWKQAADILVYGEQSGTVQVGYLQERPQSDEGPFLKEERSLLNVIVERLGQITEHMRAEEKVREQRQFLQIVLDSLAHPFCVINAQDRTVEMANSAAHTGPLRGDMTCYALVHGHDQPCETVEHPCPLQEVRRTKKPVVVEHVHVVKDGRCKNVEVHGFPIFDQDGNVFQMIEYTLDITERKQVEARARQSEMRLAALEERERIGRELHDDLGQVMGYVNVQTQAALTRLEQGEAAQVKVVLSQLAQVAQQAYGDVRQYILGIRTTAAQPAPDFFAALEGYLDTLRERYGLETQVSWPEDVLESPLAPEVETQLLRIIQEALTNVRKHAGVDTARLLFTLHTDEVQVIIEDDGCGFDANQRISELADEQVTHHASRITPSDEGETASSLAPTNTEGHFGLRVMRERAESVGGGLEVRSALGEGTRVFVRLPLSLVPSP